MRVGGGRFSSVAKGEGTIFSDAECVSGQGRGCYLGCYCGVLVCTIRRNLSSLLVGMRACLSFCFEAFCGGEEEAAVLESLGGQHP